MSYVTYTCDSS